MKQNYSRVIFLALLLFTLSFTTAITGKIGNARAIIDAEVGDTLERTILIINDNDVPVVIEIFPSGDLQDNVEILDNNFTLQPGEEQKARFELFVTTAGVTETNINVRFTEVGKKNGIGMTSRLIIKAEGESLFEGVSFGEGEEGEEIQESVGRGVAQEEEGGTSGGLIVALVVIMVLVVFLGAIFFDLKKGSGTTPKRKKRKK